MLNNLIRPFIIALAEYCVMPDKVTVYIMECKRWYTHDNWMSGSV